jgi:hypothetical protein
VMPSDGRSVLLSIGITLWFVRPNTKPSDQTIR